MKLGAMAGGVCRICGSDTLGADIGCSCLKLYNRAKTIALKNHNSESLEYNYGIEMRYIMDKFVKAYDERLEKHNGNLDKMFRNDFKKSFYPSVVEFYKTKGFVSKKQLEIVRRELDLRSDTYVVIDKKRENFLNSFARDNDSEIVEITRNLWKQKKEK